MPRHAGTQAADLLRGLAIVAVLISHAIGPQFGYVFPWDGMVRAFSRGGQPIHWGYYPVSLLWTGVSLFFVLSGFCIHLSFLRSKKFGVGHFYWRRAWRIVPAYWVALAAFIWLNRVCGFPVAPHSQMLHFLFLHNATQETFFGINPSFWSIAVEVQLYLLYPLLLAARARWGMPFCLAATLALGCVWRAVAVSQIGLPDHLATALVNPVTTWFDWTLGAWVAECFYAGRVAFTRRGAWLAGLGPVFLVSTLWKPLSVFSFMLASVLAAVVLDGWLRRQPKRGLFPAMLVFIGTISYSLYLWHQPVLPFFEFFLAKKLGVPLTWITGFISLMLACWVSYWLLERSGMALGDAVGKWLRRRNHGRPL